MAERKFDYVAIGANGKKKKGVIEANTQAGAYQLLSAQGLIPKQVRKHNETVLSKEIEIPGFQKKAKLGALAVFAKQFALLNRTGIPILESLRILGEQTDDKVLKTALEDVYDDVERGLPLASAMDKHPLAFPKLLVAVVSVGEEGGFLDKSLDQIAKSYTADLELRQKVKSAMTYPVIVVCVALAVLVAMLIFVVPQFSEMFESMGAELPVPTQILVALSDNMIIVGPIAAAVVLVLYFLYSRFKNEEWLRSRVDMFKLKAPVFGKLTTKIAIARFSRNLAMMLSAGVPLTKAFKLVGDTANNWVIANAIEKTIKDIEIGRTLADSIDNFTVFPEMVKRLIAVGERSGQLAEMLNQAGEFYESEVSEASDALASSIEPLMILILGGMVGGMLLALYMPMFSMMSTMAEG